jgi:hypothetical protein
VAAIAEAAVAHVDLARWSKMPIYAVGGATADAVVRSFGVEPTGSAAGSAAQLADEILARCVSQRTPMLTTVHGPIITIPVGCGVCVCVCVCMCVCVCVCVCGVVWCGVGWWGGVWCGVVWCGVVWCGVVWCGVVVKRHR